MNNVTSLNTENKMLKDDLSVPKIQAITNRFGSLPCPCNVSKHKRAPERDPFHFPIFFPVRNTDV